MKNIAILIGGIIIGSLVTSFILHKKPDIWIPALEKTSFEYMNDIILKVTEDIEKAEKELEENHRAELSQSLHQTMNEVQKLQHYYIPMTKVRQLIYDSEELYTLNKKKEAVKYLRKAESLTEEVGEPVNELYIMIQELILSIKKSQNSIQEKFANAGRKANLLLIKGGLIIK